MINIKEIPFFFGKSNVVLQNLLYSNDPEPACFLVSANSIDYKVRLFSQWNPYGILREAKALSLLCKSKKIYIPQILQARISGETKKQYLIESFFPGRSLEKYDQPRTLNASLLIQEIYTFLKELNCIHDNAFHSFTNKRYPNYADMLIARVQIHLRNISRYDAAKAKQYSCVVALLDQHRSLMANVVPTLLHFDIKPQNIIFDDSAMRICVVDYEHARFGDAYHELLRARMKATQNSGPYQKIWSEVESLYYQEFGQINEALQLLYWLYCHIAELPYLFRSDKTIEIKTSCNIIESVIDKIYAFNR